MRKGEEIKDRAIAIRNAIDNEYYNGKIETNTRQHNLKIKNIVILYKRSIRRPELMEEVKAFEQIVKSTDIWQCKIKNLTEDAIRYISVINIVGVGVALYALKIVRIYESYEKKKKFSR